MSGICSQHRGYSADCETCNAIPSDIEDHINYLDRRVIELEEVLELIAAPMRPDGTWNRDRYACYLLAKEAFKRKNEY